jgi:hypothetical protein
LAISQTSIEAPAKETDRFRTAVTFEMPGATWEYVNALHAMYRFHENWPKGMLCHITGEAESGIRSIGIWRSRELEQEYFRRVAVEVITESVRVIGPPPAEAEAENFEPRACAISRVLLTDLCAAFADIGEDPDGGAIHMLGTDPVIDRGAPVLEPGTTCEGLILAWTTSDPGGAVEHRVWTSADHALGESLPLRRISFGSTELPA